MENQQLVSPHDNAPAHQSVLVKDFFSKEQCDNTGASSYLAELILPVPSTEIGIEGLKHLLCN
jgi:hypothetical protein